MADEYRRLRCWWWVVLATLLGGSLAARAQARPDTASCVLRGGQLRNLGGTMLSHSRQLVLVSVQPPSHNQTLVEQQWRDEQLRLRRTTQLRLSGKLELAAVQSTAHYVLLQLLSRDSLVLATVDTLGRLVAQVRQPLAVRRGLFGASDLELKKADNFLTIEQQRETSCRLVCRAPNLALRWEKTFGPTPEANLLTAAADSTHLWVILMADYDKRHPSSTAVCLDLATGRELTRVELTNEKARRVPSVAEMGPGHSLLVAGHAFDGEAAVRRRTGDLFFQRLSPSGQVLSDYLTDFEQAPALHGAAAEHVQWQLLWPTGQNRVRLVGETYTSTSAGSSIAAGAFTMGLAGQATLRPQEVVSLELNPGGQVEQLRVVPLPLDKSSFTVPNFRQARILARMALEAGTFRTRGLAYDSTTLVLSSPQQIQTLNLRTSRLQLVRPAPEKGTADVLYVGKDYLLLGEVRNSKNSMRILRVPLPTAN